MPWDSANSGLNAGILLLSQLAIAWPITPDSWRWLFQIAGVPAVLGVFVLIVLPESPQWLASQGKGRKQSTPLQVLFSPALIRFTILGIVLSSVPMIGAWSASKWMIPWADKVAGSENHTYKAVTQGWWALGATLGSFFGAQLASWLGRKWSYCLISVASFSITVAMFQWTAPLEPTFHPIVFAQGFVATLFFGWLALSLPELYPVSVRATGSGLAYNFGRFATAIGVLLAGFIFTELGGSYPRVGTICACVYAVGIVVIWFLPTGQSNAQARLDEH